MCVEMIVALGDGTLKVYNTYTGKVSYNMQTAGREGVPFTCVRWRPTGG